VGSKVVVDSIEGWVDFSEKTLHLLNPPRNWGQSPGEGRKVG